MSLTLRNITDVGMQGDDIKCITTSLNLGWLKCTLIFKDKTKNNEVI